MDGYMGTTIGFGALAPPRQKRFVYCFCSTLCMVDCEARIVLVVNIDCEFEIARRGIVLSQASNLDSPHRSHPTLPRQEG